MKIIKDKYIKIENWKGWRWIYFGGMLIGFYIFFGNFYNAMTDYINLHRDFFSISSSHSLKRKFYPFSSVKIFTLNAQISLIVIFFLPCLASLFYKANYLKKVIFIIMSILILSLFSKFFLIF